MYITKIRFFRTANEFNYISVRIITYISLQLVLTPKETKISGYTFLALTRELHDPMNTAPIGYRHLPNVNCHIRQTYSRNKNIYS